MVDYRVVTVFVAVVAALGDPAVAQAPFTEEALARGIDYGTLSNNLHPYGYGAAFADLDGDGDPDLVLVGRGDGRVGVYENDGTGFFTDRSVGNGIPVIAGASGVTAADYDGDGDLDIHLSNFLGADVLLRNDGGFTFNVVTTASGVGNPGTGTGCA